MAPSAIADGGYQLEEELGRGGTSIVYRARDVDLRRHVAIKLIAKTFAESAGSVGGVETFRREAACLAAVRSPFIAEVYAFGVNEGACFIVMEYVGGKDLARVIDDHRARSTEVPLRLGLAILEQLAEGLAAVHAASIVHRDIKPSNVVIERGTGRPVLVDFGLSVREGDTPVPPLGLGTPAFMAPELASPSAASGVSPRADVYAFACVAFELITGQRAFTGRDAADVMRKHRDVPAPRPSSIKADLAPFDDAFAQALAKDPTARPESCAAFVTALRVAARPSLGVDEEAEPRDAWRPRTPGAPEPLRVLVVDDDEDFRAFLSHASKAFFYGRNVDVVGVETGADALAVARSRMPQLVFLDYDMPGLDGVATLTRMRELPDGRDARVIVISGSVDVEVAWRFAVLGVIDFAEKPVDLKKLIDTITSALAVPIRSAEPARARPPPRSI